jgi:hypothetical protein
MLSPSSGWSTFSEPLYARISPQRVTVQWSNLTVTLFDVTLHWFSPYFRKRRNFPIQWSSTESGFRSKQDLLHLQFIFTSHTSLSAKQGRLASQNRQTSLDTKRKLSFRSRKYVALVNKNLSQMLNCIDLR